MRKFMHHLQGRIHQSRPEPLAFDLLVDELVEPTHLELGVFVELVPQRLCFARAQACTSSEHLLDQGLTPQGEALELLQAFEVLPAAQVLADCEALQPL
jgi:hypothetical protein